MNQHPVVIAGFVFVALVLISRVVTRPAGSDVLAVALGNPSGTVPYAVGASAMGPVGGMF